MEELLKTRQLSSASARKRKIQERQDKVRKIKQRNLEKRDTDEFRYGYGYGYCSDEEELSDSEGNHATFSPVAEGGLDRPPAIASPSTGGARTPDDIASPPYGDPLQAWPDVETRIASADDAAGDGSSKLDMPSDDGEGLDMSTPPSAKPILQPTLTSRADFAFDFYAPDIAGDDSLDTDLDRDLDSDLDLNLEIPDLEPDTPIETATPVTYSQPRTRPSMICISIKTTSPSFRSWQSSTRPSISSLPAASSPPPSSKYYSAISGHYTTPSITSRKSGLQHPSPSLRSLPLPTGHDRRMSNASLGSGYAAFEALPLDLSAPPVPSIRPSILASASRESLLEGMEDRRSSSSHAKKPSVLSTLRKSGLNNLINYVKDVRAPSRDDVQSRPMMAASDRDLNEGTPPSYPAFAPHPDDYPVPLRPRTATAGSARSWGENSVTALPMPPEPPMPSIAKSSTFEVARKKSFSALRSRSSSIGKALRSASSSVVPTIATMPYPGKPSFTPTASESPSRNQSRKASMDLANFPLPPPSPLAMGRNSPRMSPGLERNGFTWPKG